MKKRRIISGLLALLLAVSLIPAAEAAGTPTVSISSGTVKAGESVTLTVSIKDNPGLASMLLYIYYDMDAFEVNPSDIKAAGEFLFSGGLMGNTIAAAKKNDRYYGDAGKDGVLALWYSGLGTDVTVDDNILTIIFTAKADAINGMYSVSVGYSPNDTCDEDGNYHSLQSVSGTITVTGNTQSGGNQSSADTETPVFTDVNGHWAYDYIEDAAQLGLMHGYQNLFRPDDSMTRCEFVTALWRAMGEPRAKKASTFTDLNQSWYLDAVAWAQENDIIQGTGGTRFEPYWLVSREQVALILHRLTGEPAGMGTMLAGTYDKLFKDSSQIHSWAKAGLYWAVYEDIYCGVTSANVGTYLAPTAEATRAHIAVMLVRYLNTQGGE